MMVRETPLHLGHLRLMTTIAEYGATIFPPMPAFYNHPRSINDLVTQTASLVLDHLKIEYSAQFIIIPSNSVREGRDTH